MPEGDAKRKTFENYIENGGFPLRIFSLPLLVRK